MQRQTQILYTDTHSHHTHTHTQNGMVLATRDNIVWSLDNLNK